MRVVPLLICACDHCLACVLCVCYVCVFIRVCGSVQLLLEPRVSVFFFNFFCSTCCCCCIMSVAHRPSSPQALLHGSHGTTAVAHQVRPFVTVMDGASVCACASHGNEHIISREVQGCGAGDRAIQTHTSSRRRATAQPRLP